MTLFSKGSSMLHGSEVVKILAFFDRTESHTDFLITDVLSELEVFTLPGRPTSLPLGPMNLIRVGILFVNADKLRPCWLILTEHPFTNLYLRSDICHKPPITMAISRKKLSLIDILLPVHSEYFHSDSMSQHSAYHLPHILTRSDYLHLLYEN